MDCRVLTSQFIRRVDHVMKIYSCQTRIVFPLGLDKMYSLTDLNLSDNNFTDIGSVLTLGELPCLESIDFRDNAMTKEPIYRIRVLTAFDDRAEQVSTSV